MGEWKVMRSILVSYELFVTYMTSWVVYKFPKNIKSKNQNRETTKFKTNNEAQKRSKPYIYLVLGVLFCICQ